MKKTVFLLLLAAMFAPWATQAQIPLFTDGFEDNNNNLPTGWNRDGTYSDSWGVLEGSQWAYEGDYYMISGSGSANSGKKLMSPNLAGYFLTVNSAELRFAFQQPQPSGGGHANMRVFYRTSNDDEAWIQIWECTELVTDWQLAQGIVLPDIHNITSTDDFYQIAFDMHTDYSGSCVILDDVQIFPVACPTPINLTVSAITGTTATVSWTEIGNAETWQFCLNNQEDHLTDVTTNSYTITGLTPETSYTVKVRAVCGGDEYSEWSTPESFEAANNKLVIGSEPFGQSDRLPIGIGYSTLESISEQIYTSDELGAAGTILSIDFYGINNYRFNDVPVDLERNIDIYMVHTDLDEFSTDANGYIIGVDENNEQSSWIGVAETNRVYQGRVVVPFGEGWTTITLDTPFDYNGTSNVVLVVVYNEGYRSQDITFRTFSSSVVHSISNTSSSSSDYFNPTTGIYGSGGSTCRCKNQIRLLKVTCMPPAGLVASNVTDETATLSWTDRGDATSWVVEYADNINFIGAISSDVSGTPTILLTGLDGETQYYVRVKAVCSSDDESPWSNPLIFTTDYCPPANKCEIFYELHAETGDDVASVAWDGAAIRVIDYTDPDNEILLAKLTIEGLEDYESEDSDIPLYTNHCEVTDYYFYARGTLPLCNGRDIRFEWENSYWGHDDLYSFVVYDADYVTLFSGTGDGNGEIGGGDEATKDGGDYRTLYEYENVDCRLTSCPRPTNVTVTYEGGTTATVTWDNVGSDYDVGLIDHETGTFINIYSVTTNFYTFGGLEFGTTYDVQVVTVCDRGDNENEDISHVSRTITFTTDLCMPEDMCAISYELHDYESNGWSGAAINVVDVTSGIVLDTWTIANGGTGFGPVEPRKSGTIDETDGFSYANGTLRVCDGRQIKFVWISGYNDNSCSYIVYDEDGEVILSSSEDESGDEKDGDGDGEEEEEETDVLATYTVDCPDCSRPYDLAVNYEGGTTATVTWNGFAISYNIYVNDGENEDVIENATSPYTLNLDLATTYEVKVQADCGSEYGQSGWTRPVSFTTDLCEDVCEIRYELIDSWGDGWNGNGIQVVDVTTEFIYGTLTIENGRTASGTLRVCNGGEILFTWEEGVYANECSYTVFGVDGEEIFSGEGSMDDEVSYMVNCGAGGIDANGWYAISAPKYDEDGNGYNIDVDNVVGLIPTETSVEYDLFRYNELSAKWENQKVSEVTGSTASGFGTLDCGRGYIYRRSASTALSFNGNPYMGELLEVQSLTSSCTTDVDLKGFNLIGNPYQHSIIKGEDFDEDGLLDVGYHSLNRDGSWLAHLDSDPIAVGQGVLVRVSGDDEVDLTFNDSESEIVPEEPSKKNSADRSLQFIVTGGGYKDVAFALYADREGLHKMPHLNAEAPSLSIAQDGTDYAIATISEGTEAFPLKFRSIIQGDYTLTVNAESGFDYLHLIDKVANRDIDLLRQPTYTFTHMGNQAMANRFMVKLSSEGESTGDIFAYQNGDRIVVEGTGTLQVYDVLGRQLFTHEINSQFSMLNSQFPSTGVYILRLNGKSQKLVIK